MEAALGLPPGLSEEEKRRMIDEFQKEQEKILASIEAFKAKKDSDAAQVVSDLELARRMQEQEFRRAARGRASLPQQRPASSRTTYTSSPARSRRRGSRSGLAEPLLPEIV